MSACNAQRLDSNATRLVASGDSLPWPGAKLRLMTYPDDLARASVIRLQAVDEARGLRRAYAISRSTDLFGHEIVHWSWGRIGSRGQERSASFSNVEDAVRFVKSLLARRASAPRRIGTPYCPVSPENARQAHAAPAGPAVMLKEPSVSAPLPVSAPSPSPVEPTRTLGSAPLRLPMPAHVHHPFCPDYRATLAELRYRLMRYALGMRECGRARFSLQPWGPCQQVVRDRLAATAEQAGGDAQPTFDLEQLRGLLARLEAEVAPQPFSAQPARQAPAIR